MRWVPRGDALPPLAAIAFGETARTLARRLLSMSDEQQARFQAAAGSDALAVIGESEHLPWVEGIRYLGRDPNAEGLLLPTCSKPSVPIDLFVQAILRTFPLATRPLAVLDHPRCVLPLGSARSLDREALEHWLAGVP